MALSQYILEAKERDRMQVRLRNAWLIRIRWVYLIVLTGITLLSFWLIGESARSLKFIAILGVTGLLVNLMLSFAILLTERSTRYYKAIAIFQITLDLWLAANIIYLQGGTASRATLLFTIPILAAGILFSSSLAYLAAGVSTIFYAGAVLAQQHGNFTTYGLRPVAVPIAFYGAIFFVIAILVSRFSSLTSSEQQQKTYTELLAMLRHQLHHPAGVIAALTEMLEHDPAYGQWSGKAKSYLTQLKIENLRMNSMVTNLLAAIEDPNKNHPAHMQTVNLVALINDSTISCATAAKRLDDLVTNLPNRNVEVRANPVQLRTALDNILENSFRYSPTGTPVTIDLEEDKTSVSVTISDKGKGMTLGQQKMLFKLFSKLDESADSSADNQSQELYSMGLGLYVAKSILERHHGSLKLTSSPNQGTKVIININKGDDNVKT